MKNLIVAVLLTALFSGCSSSGEKQEQAKSPIEMKVDDYKTVKLTTDLSVLSEKEKQMIPLLIEAGKIMDDLFWYEAYGDKDKLLSSTEDPPTKKYLNINYGPWIVSTTMHHFWRPSGQNQKEPTSIQST